MSSVELKTTASKIGSCTVLITCWMEGTVMTTPNEKSWLSTWTLDGSPFGYLLLQEEDHLLRLCLAFLNEEICQNNNLVSVQVFVEGIHPLMNIARETAETTTWWCSDWVNNSLLRHQRYSCGSCHRNPIQYHLPFNQLIVNFASPIHPERGDSRVILKGEHLALERLNHLLANSSLSDVTFRVKGETIKAHSVIVAAGSPVLSAMFQHDFEENRTRTVVIDDTKAQVFKQFLQYIYIGTAPEMEDVAMDLLVVADKYGVDSLKEECATVLSRKLKLDNVISILILAHLHSIPKLFQSALDFMAKHNRIVCSLSDYAMLMENYPKLCFKVNQYMFGSPESSIASSADLIG